ncbi:MAG: hypothetical protein IKR25_11705 [Muribaculaceae bacterium]|nr:hypothetical protein [Muribaculaceae bacterium]
MFKRILIAMMLLTALVTQAEGWKAHQQFIGTKIQGIIDADNHVYQLVCNSVLRFDKATGNIESLSRNNGLTDALVNQMYYNYDRHYLLLTYANSNIDIIYDDGRIVNVPVLSNYTSTDSKIINDVTFYDGHIYVSTDFGFVVVNDVTLEMEYYRNYGQPFRSIAFTGGRFNALVGDSLYSCTKAKPETFADFHSVAMVKNRETNSAGKAVTISSAFLHTLNDSSLLLRITSTNDSTYLKRITFMPQDSVDVFQYATRLTASNPFTSLQPTPTGFLLNVAATTKIYYTLTPDGVTFKAVNGKGNGIFSCNPAGNGTLWGLGANGLFDNAAATTYYQTNSIGLALPYWAAYNNLSNKLYLVNTADTPLVPSSPAKSTAFTAYVYDGESWSGDGCIHVTGGVAEQKATSGWQPVFAPNEPNTYYEGSYWSGVLKVRNDTLVAVYDERNSTIMYNRNYFRGIQCLRFDSQGNLWVVQCDFENQTNVPQPAMVLPASKLALDNNVTAEDWYSYALPTTTTSKFNSFAIGRGDVKVYCPGDLGAGKTYLILWRGPIDGEQEIKQHTSMRDQEGTQFKNGAYVTMAADSTGLVWVGSSELYYFDPTTAFGDVLYVTRPRTTAGDFALDGVAIEHIDVDTQNRKWISTKSDGVYLLSPDGSEVLKHFTTSNSIMPSNNVYSTCPMGNTGHAMIMTSLGVVEYLGDDSDELAEVGTVEVFPNPVRPDFTGLVTLSGVSRGQTVRITNQQDEVVAEFFVTDAATWDACYSTGERVETGRYAVRVSQADGSFTQEPQATVMVIR